MGNIYPVGRGRNDFLRRPEEIPSQSPATSSTLKGAVTIDPQSSGELQLPSSLSALKDIGTSIHKGHDAYQKNIERINSQKSFFRMAPPNEALQTIGEQLAEIRGDWQTFLNRQSISLQSLGAEIRGDSPDLQNLDEETSKNIVLIRRTQLEVTKLQAEAAKKDQDDFFVKRRDSARLTTFVTATVGCLVAVAVGIPTGGIGAVVFLAIAFGAIAGAGGYRFATRKFDNIAENREEKRAKKEAVEEFTRNEYDIKEDISSLGGSFDEDLPWLSLFADTVVGRPSGPEIAEYPLVE